MTPEERCQRLRQFILHYEIANGWLMVLAWIPWLPEWACGAIARYYAWKAVRKAENMQWERIEEFLKEP